MRKPYIENFSGGEGIDAAAGELFTKLSTVAKETANGLTQGVNDWNDAFNEGVIKDINRFIDGK